MASLYHRPWDQQLAGLLVRPLARTSVHPNHLTTLSLVLGMTASALFCLGPSFLAGLAAGCYMLAVFTDHTDGELARLTGKTSRFGHYYDYIVGGVNYMCLFAGIGYGLRNGPLGAWALILGLAAALSNPIILTLRMPMDRRHGAAAVAHPYLFGFEIEDFIYLIGPITWFAGIEYFFFPYALGNLGYFAWTVAEVVRWSRHTQSSPED